MRHWRKMTWALTIWTVVMGIWIVAGAATASGQAKNCGTLDQATCNSASDAGTAIGVGLLIFLWFLGFVVLSLVWFMTRPKTTPLSNEAGKVYIGTTVAESQMKLIRGDESDQYRTQGTPENPA